MFRCDQIVIVILTNEWIYIFSFTSCTCVISLYQLLARRGCDVLLKGWRPVGYCQESDFHFLPSWMHFDEIIRSDAKNCAL